MWQGGTLSLAQKAFVSAPATLAPRPMSPAPFKNGAPGRTCTDTSRFKRPLLCVELPRLEKEIAGQGIAPYRSAYETNPATWPPARVEWIRSGDLHPALGLTKTVNRCLFLTGSCSNQKPVVSDQLLAQVRIPN